MFSPYGSPLTEEIKKELQVDSAGFITNYEDLKKKWFECCKDKILQIQYILLPILFLEIITLFVVITWYLDEILKSS